MRIWDMKSLNWWISWYAYYYIDNVMLKLKGIYDEYICIYLHLALLDNNCANKGELSSNQK